MATDDITPEPADEKTDVASPKAEAASPRTELAPPSSDRLQAVLDVDLPLVVRFGTAVMPLRQLSALGSGSTVDMNRSPDDPVELLVGDRVIARGEVVVVDGNYGVRITELTNQVRAVAPAPEAQTK